MTLVLIFIYSMGNLGVYFLYSRQRPKEFNPVLHVLFPILSRSRWCGSPIIRSCLCRQGRSGMCRSSWGPGWGGGHRGAGHGAPGFDTAAFAY